MYESAVVMPLATTETLYLTLYPCGVNGEGLRLQPYNLQGLGSAVRGFLSMISEMRALVIYRCRAATGGGRG